MLVRIITLFLGQDGSVLYPRHAGTPAVLQPQGSSEVLDMPRVCFILETGCRQGDNPVQNTGLFCILRLSAENSLVSEFKGFCKFVSDPNEIRSEAE